MFPALLVLSLKAKPNGSFLPRVFSAASSPSFSSGLAHQCSRPALMWGRNEGRCRGGQLCREPPRVAQGSHLSPALPLGPAAASTGMNVIARLTEPSLGTEGVSVTPQRRKPFEILGLHP